MELKAMTKDDAFKKWSQAASVNEQGIRLDNWRPIAHALRHCTQEDQIEETSPGILSVTRTIGKGDDARKVSFSLVVA
jgi:hypothetical protein